MQAPLLHRFEREGRCYVVDTHTCFCFECDRISWDVLEYYPREPVNRICRLLEDKYPRKELEEVVGELEWLRVTKAILSPLDDEMFLTKATHAGGLRKLTLTVGPSGEAPKGLTRAGLLLLARAQEEKDLTLSLYFERMPAANWNRAADTLAEIGAAARLAGKKFRIELDLPFRPFPENAATKSGCNFRCRVVPSAEKNLAECIAGTMVLDGKKPAAAVKILLEKYASESVRVVARPVSEAFHPVIETLHDAGYEDIIFDLPGAWMAQPRLNPDAVVDALESNIFYYAEQLLRNKPLRVEPFATLFKAIHNGTPCYRVDPSGIEVLAADEGGRLYPSPPFVGNSRFVLGSLGEDRFEDAMREPFLLSGSLQRPVCLRCWARGLCGGGHTAIHYARSGDIRFPEPVWCDAQRRWTGAAVAAFNRIASAGINFDHLAASPQPRARHFSLFGAAKALFQGQLAARPLLEGGAEILVQWENWNRSAYFLCNETGAVTATRYDREMDALHPTHSMQELVLVRRNGTPCGLLKLQMLSGKKLARAWLYLQDEGLYAKTAFQQTFRTLLAEVCRDGRIRHILTPVTMEETKLAAALLAAGFAHGGIEREALYRQGAYHNVQIFVYMVDS